MKTIPCFTLFLAALCVTTSLSARAEDTAEEHIKKVLSRKVSFEFIDTPLNDALDFIRHLANVPIVVDPKALAGGKDKTINLRVADMDLDKALQWILKLSELEYKIQDQAVFIFPPVKEVPAAAAPRREREVEPPPLNGVLRARFSTGESVEVDATMLRQFPQLEREILALNFDPEKDAILALSMGVDIPARVPLDIFVASAKKIAPEAKFDHDDALKLLLVRSKDADDLRRVNAIARALRRGVPDAAQGQPALNTPRKLTINITGVPLKRVLALLARQASITVTIAALDKDADERFLQPVALNVTDMDFNACLQVLSKMTDLKIELKGDRIECSSLRPATEKPAAIKPPRPPQDGDAPARKNPNELEF